MHLRRSPLDEAHGKFQLLPAYLHVYVPDTDALHAQPVRAGASSAIPPEDAPYGERAATVKDPCGNTWFLAAHFRHGPTMAARVNAPCPPRAVPRRMATFAMCPFPDSNTSFW
jgi:hypothetical protein